MPPSRICSNSDSRVLGKIRTLEGLRKKVKEVFPPKSVYDEIFKIVAQCQFPPTSYRILAFNLHPIAETALKICNEKSTELRFPFLNHYVGHCLDLVEAENNGMFPHAIADLGQIRGAEEINHESAVTLAEMEALRKACSVSEAAKRAKK